MSADLSLVHLYPDLLMTYGDRGNVLTLSRRAAWRGFSVQVTGVSRGEPIPAQTDLVMIGGGSDRIQHLVGTDFAEREGQLRELAAGGCVILGVCGGYQLLGHRYSATDGADVPGLGLLDVTTGAGSDRIVGRVSARAHVGGHTFPLQGFENHAGRTRLGSDAVALATVAAGQGNNGEDGTEGAIQGTVVGTYLHGPVLPTAPEFADSLLKMAMARVTGGTPLVPLDDALETKARRFAESLAR